MKIKFNLLPKKQKRYHDMNFLFHYYSKCFTPIQMVFLFLIGGLFAVYFILKTEISVMEEVKSSVTENERYKKVAVMHDEFIEVNKKVDLINKLDKNHLKWSRMIIFLSETVPSSIVIESIKTTNDSVSIKAQANTRESVVEFKNALKDMEYDEKKCFTNVVVPEEQLATPVDIFFTMTFKINLDCLK